MNPEEIQILQIIKDIARKNEFHHAPLSMIVMHARKYGIPTGNKSMHRIMSDLCNDGLIKEDPNIFQTFIPADFEDMEIPTEKESVDNGDILNAIKSFFIDKGIYPTPTEIFDEYAKIHGHVNPESFTRKVRKMFEQGKLLRTGDNRYYFRNIGISENSLGSFTFGKK